MRYFRLQKRKTSLDMSLLIYQCLQTDAKIVKTVDKLEMSTGPGKIFSVAFRETCEKKSEEQIEKLFWPKIFKRNLL